MEYYIAVKKNEAAAVTGRSLRYIKKERPSAEVCRECYYLCTNDTHTHTYSYTYIPIYAETISGMSSVEVYGCLDDTGGRALTSPPCIWYM